jgi:hypothetical protein
MIPEALTETSTSVAAGHADIENLGEVVNDVDTWRVGNVIPSDVGEAYEVREADKRVRLR